MSQRLDLVTCSLEQIRIVVPMWHNSTILEALRKIRATWKVHAGKMDELQSTEFIRKETIIRQELRLRMRHAGILGSQTHWQQENLVGHNPHEQALKVFKR